MKHYVYIVKWRDSQTYRGWQSMRADHSTSLITSVGWLVKQTKRDVTITTCISDNGSVREAVTIPRESITRMTKLNHYVEGE